MTAELKMYDDALEKTEEPRIALITACGLPGGTGYSTARWLVADGFNCIVLASRELAAAEACCAALRESLGDEVRGLRILPLRLSSADRAHHAEALRVLTEDLEVKHLDALVNNESTTSVAAAYRAGYMPTTTPPKPSPTTLYRQLGLCSGADLLALVGQNVTSAMEITNLMLPHLARSPSGAACVVNLVSPRSSVREATQAPVKSLATMAFDASQAALAMLCAYQTAHLAPYRIRLNGASRGHGPDFDRYDGARSVEAGSRVVAWLCTARWDENGAPLTGALLCDHEGDLEKRNAAEPDPSRWVFSQLNW